MSTYRARKSGFTLVEILIVVIILGILAAIVIPQFTNASQDARRSSLTSQLQTLRSQIELYKLQHKDELPDLTAADGWDLLTQKTDADGVVAADGEFGPYLQAASANPLVEAADATLVVDGTDATAAADNMAFIYDYDGGAGTGKIWAVEKDGDTYSIFSENGEEAAEEEVVP